MDLTWRISCCATCKDIFVKWHYREFIGENYPCSGWADWFPKSLGCIIVDPSLFTFQAHTVSSKIFTRLPSTKIHPKGFLLGWSQNCTGQSRSSTPDSMSLWPTLCALMCGSLNFSYKAGSMTLSKMSWYAQVLRTSFTRTKRHSHLWWLVRGEGTLPTSKSSDRIMLP